MQKKIINQNYLSQNIRNEGIPTTIRIALKKKPCPFSNGVREE